jgi:hypothetical protein
MPNARQITFVLCFFSVVVLCFFFVERAPVSMLYARFLDLSRLDLQSPNPKMLFKTFKQQDFPILI